MKAIWNGKILAESNDTIVIEDNHYFPPDSINEDYFMKSDHHTVSPWKGNASYHTLVVDDKKNENAAWYYPEPKGAVKKIKNYIAFWHGVEVVEE